MKTLDLFNIFLDYFMERRDCKFGFEYRTQDGAKVTAQDVAVQCLTQTKQ